MIWFLLALMAGVGFFVRRLGDAGAGRRPGGLLMGLAIVLLIGHIVQVGSPAAGGGSAASAGSAKDGVFELANQDTVAALGTDRDGARMVTETSTGKLIVWDIAASRALWQTDGFAWQFSPDGHLIVVAMNGPASGHALRVLSADDGAVLANLQGAPAAWEIEDIVFSEDGDRLLVSSKQLDVAEYAVGALEGGGSHPSTAALQPVVLPREVKLSNWWASRSPRVGFGNNPHDVFVLSRDGWTLERWRLDAQPQLSRTVDFRQTHGLAAQGLTVDGTHAFACSEGGAAVVETDAMQSFSVRHESVAHPLPPANYSLQILCAMSPDGDWIAQGLIGSGGGMGYAVNAWSTEGNASLADGNPVGAGTTGDAPSLVSFEFSPDSRYLYAADSSMHVHAYDLHNVPAHRVISAPTFANVTGVPALIAASNAGVAYSYQGATRVVWAARER